MCSLPRPPGGVSPHHGTIHIQPAPSRNGIALPYLRALTPEGKWTCPSAVCQLTGLCGKMDPPAGRRVGFWRLTRLLFGVRLSPDRQENQHSERPVSSSPTRISTRRNDWTLNPRLPPPPTSANGTARIFRNSERARALPTVVRQPDQPPLSHARSRPRLATQGRGFAHRVGAP